MNTCFRSVGKLDIGAAVDAKAWELFDVVALRSPVAAPFREVQLDRICNKGLYKFDPFTETFVDLEIFAANTFAQIFLFLNSV